MPLLGKILSNKSQAYLRFAFFHQNEGVLHQFFLNECLLILQALQEKADDGLVARLIGDIEKRAFWESAFGHLPKLQLFYALLNTHFADPQSLAIKQIGSILTRACKKATLYPDWQELKRDIKKITTLFFEKLPSTPDKEPVLFFLLRSHEQFEALYGKPIIATLFVKLFSGGIEEAGVVIEEYYKRNGFNHLLPLIDEKIHSLKGGRCDH
jgi:hypothetical protein